MKILKITGIFVALLVVVFLSIGFFAPSFEYSSSVIVHAPAEKCWSVLHDTSRMNKWMAGFEKLTLTSGQPMQPGATYQLVLNQDEVYILSEKLIEVKAPEKAVYEMTNDVMKSDYDFILSEKDSQTEISSHYRVIGKNLVWKSLLFLFKSTLKAGADEQLVKLKLEIEAGDMDFD